MERQGVRSAWDAVPPPVKAAVDDMLGAPVVETRSVEGGFSPGPAVRAQLLDGRTVFIKAAGKALNEDSPQMHRRERDVLSELPPFVPAPALVGCVDDGDWVALAVEWIDGRNPTATDIDDVQRTLDLLHLLADGTDGVEISGVGPVAQTHVEVFGHWSRLAEEQPNELDTWSRRHADQLAAIDADAFDACAGNHLVHLDVRTDNALLATAGPSRDVLVDWPGAAIGAPWIDLVALLPALHLDGGPPPAEVFSSTRLGQRAEAEAVDAFLVALAGFFSRNSLQPPPPGLPTLRPFQAAQGLIARRWVAQRLRLH